MFKHMDSMVNQFFGNLPKSYVVHCDYIAATIAGNLKTNDLEGLISSVDRPKMDLGSDGALRSTKKTIEVVDRNGTRYRVTVEEA